MLSRTHPSVLGSRRIVKVREALDAGEPYLKLPVLPIN